MNDLLSFLDNAALQALSIALAVIGLSLAFRVLRFPDLSADGSFIVGAASFAIVIGYVENWIVGLVVAALCGAAAGGLTAAMTCWLGVNRLLSGILTSMICYSIGFRIHGGSPNVGLLENTTMLSSAQKWDRANFEFFQIHLAQLSILAFFVIIFAAATTVLLRSEYGLSLRATGANEGLARKNGHSVAGHTFVGLMLANGLIAISAALMSSQQGFSDINLGIGIVITLVAALVLGEEVMRWINIPSLGIASRRVLAALLGAFVYYSFYTIIVRASIRGWIPITLRPTDLKMLSAIIIITVVGVRALEKNRPKEEVLPL